MNEDAFNSLKEILKTLEKEDKNKSSIASAIVKLIAYQNNEMTEKQKSFILSSFSHYERRRHSEAFTKDVLSKQEHGSF